MKGIFDECNFAPLPSLPYLYTQKIGRMDRSQNKTIMKKYTIKEFTEGKKAVKIENEEQWNKLNKVHKLTIKFYNSNLYTNQNTYNGGRQFYIDCGYETLEFSQLDFEDEFVVGFKLKNVKYLEATKELIKSLGGKLGDDGWWDENAANNLKEKGWNFANGTNYGSIAQIMKEAGVLDLWFEPVYAIKFKENDWVVPLVESGYSRPAGSHCRTTARAYKVYHVDSKGVRLYEKDNVSTDGNGYLNFKYVRLANPEEIKAAQIQLPIIKDYNGTLNGYIVKYGCTEVNTNCLIDIYDDILSFNVPDPKLKDYDGGNVSIKAVILSNGTSVSLEQIKQIVKYINNK